MFYKLKKYIGIKFGINILSVRIIILAESKKENIRIKNQATKYEKFYQRQNDFSVYFLTYEYKEKYK